MISRFAGARASVARCVARSSAALVLTVALVVISGGVARADGDPASDYLVANQVFLSSQSPGMSPAQRQLVATVAAANRAGFAIRVAVISSNYDLGSVTELWGQPRPYARFLGVELSLAYMRQRLLVVMPNGFGFNWPGHATARTYGLLATVPLGSGGGAGLAATAEVAIRRLARAAGVALPPSEPAAGGASARPGSAGTLTIIGMVAGGIAAPASTWGAGDRRAPDFLLRDQNGRPVSVAANRGRPVIVTFIDPLCRNFCPLEAQVINQMERQIPAARRPVILAVSVDVYANARRYLFQDDREWRLVPGGVGLSAVRRTSRACGRSTESRSR